MKEISKIINEAEAELFSSYRALCEGYLTEGEFCSRAEGCCAEAMKSWKEGSDGRDPDKYKDGLRKICERFCLEDAGIASWSDNIDCNLTGSLYIFRPEIPPEYRNIDDLSGMDLKLRMKGVHSVDREEEFYIHVDGKSRAAARDPKLYAEEYDAHAHFTGYFDVETSLLIPADNDKQFVIYWECYPDHSHKRWTEGNELYREKGGRINTAKLLESIGKDIAHDSEANYSQME